MIRRYNEKELIRVTTFISRLCRKRVNCWKNGKHFLRWQAEYFGTPQILGTIVFTKMTYAIWQKVRYIDYALKMICAWEAFPSRRTNLLRLKTKGVFLNWQRFFLGEKALVERDNILLDMSHNREVIIQFKDDQGIPVGPPTKVPGDTDAERLYLILKEYYESVLCSFYVLGQQKFCAGFLYQWRVSRWWT